MSSNSHYDLLFFVLLLVRFHALMCLGELVWPNKKALQNFQKVTTHDSMELLPKGFTFFLTGIRQTASSKETNLFFSITLHVMTWTSLSENIQNHATSSSLSTLNSGFVKMVLFLPIAGLFTICLTIFLLMSLATLYKQEVPLHWLRPVYPPISYKLLDVGHLKLSTFTFVTTLFYLLHFFVLVFLPKINWCASIILQLIFLLLLQLSTFLLFLFFHFFHISLFKVLTTIASFSLGLPLTSRLCHRPPKLESFQNFQR